MAEHVRVRPVDAYSRVGGELAQTAGGGVAVHPAPRLLSRIGPLARAPIVLIARRSPPQPLMAAAQIGLGAVAFETGQVGSHRQPQPISEQHQVIGRDGRQVGEGHHPQTMHCIRPLQSPRRTRRGRSVRLLREVAMHSYPERPTARIVESATRETLCQPRV
jgi:hypothetical protein